MKRIVLFLLSASVIFLTSCETTKEITLRRDGSGIFTTTNDMSGLIGLAKMSGEAKELDSLKNERPVDTTVSMQDLTDKLEDLTPEEKELAKKGTYGLNMDLKNDKFIIHTTYPFSNTKDIAVADKMFFKVISQVTKKQMMDKDSTNPAMTVPGGKIPDGPSFDNYYNLSFAKGKIERKLLADKYADVGKDESMNQLKEMSSMGIGNSKLILYLPSAAKKVEGKGVTVSEDKKTVTIMSSLEDFFEDGKALEFKIEY